MCVFDLIIYLIRIKDKGFADVGRQSVGRVELNERSSEW